MIFPNFFKIINFFTFTNKKCNKRKKLTILKKLGNFKKLNKAKKGGFTMFLGSENELQHKIGVCGTLAGFLHLLGRLEQESKSFMYDILILGRIGNKILNYHNINLDTLNEIKFEASKTIPSEPHHVIFEHIEMLLINDKETQNENIKSQLYALAFLCEITYDNSKFLKNDYRPETKKNVVSILIKNKVNLITLPEIKIYMLETKTKKVEDIEKICEYIQTLLMESEGVV